MMDCSYNSSFYFLQSGSGKLRKAIEFLSEVSIGFVFGLGLIVSGMTHPVKVSGFLSALASSWDPSLMFVMGGAIALCMPGFYLVQKLRQKPVLSDEPFHLPCISAIDRKLIVGGGLFGAGWGLAGICPGPAIVNLGSNPSVVLGTWLVAMFAAMFLQPKLTAALKL